MANITAENLQSFSNLLDVWEQNIGTNELKKMDKLAKRWIHNKNTTYKNEVRALATVLNRPGVHAFNLCPKMGCTTGLTETGTMLRTLDFSIPGLGTFLNQQEEQTEHGPYISISWPGFSGVCTGVAKNRFAIAYNEAPFEPTWWQTYFRIPASHSWPPMWLIRHVFETCKTYDEAKYMLCHEKLMAPAIFTLLSPTGRGCVIERTETKHYIHGAPTAGANHWRNDYFTGTPNQTKKQSTQRTDSLRDLIFNGQGIDFKWCVSPVLNEKETAFAAEINLQKNTLNLWNIESKQQPQAFQL